MAGLYVSIWVALGCFSAGEWGRAAAGRAARWPRLVSLAGLALALVHTLLAFALVHGWSHDDAVRKTAAQTGAVFGFAFGAGVYVNYVFYAVWGADVALWRRRRSRAGAWALRAFYLVIVLNAAVIFASGWRRLLGAAITAALLTAWARGGDGGPGDDFTTEERR